MSSPRQPALPAALVDGAGGQLAGRARRNRDGFALLEVLVGAGLMLVGLVGLITTTGSALRLVSTNHDTVVAVQAARQVAENLKNYDVISFRNLFASFNEVAADDPGGPGTAPGAFFAAPGLRPRVNDPDGFVGEILFPVGVGGATLREDVCNRDLDGDGTIDTLDHAADYVILPVTIRMAWTSSGRSRAIELHTLLMSR
jgi:hypothetical protein